MRDLDFAVKEILTSEETFVKKIQDFRPKECVKFGFKKCSLKSVVFYCKLYFHAVGLAL